MKYLISSVTFLFCFVSCTSDNVSDLTKKSIVTEACTDTIGITYQSKIIPILQTNCYSCHGQQAALGGIRLDSYSKLKIQVNNNKLYGSITHSKSFLPMPSANQKIPECDINKIKIWIDAGAQDN